MKAAQLLGLAASIAMGDRWDSATERRRWLNRSEHHRRGVKGRTNQPPGPEPFLSQAERARLFQPNAVDAPKKASRTRPASWGQPPTEVRS